MTDLHRLHRLHRLAAEGDEDARREQTRIERRRGERPAADRLTIAMWRMGDAMRAAARSLGPTLRAAQRAARSARGRGDD